MDNFAIECFLAVAETLSFTKGANRVRRSQSAVTQQINKLEHQVQKKLFVRGKKIHLTPDGKCLLPYAQQLFRLNKEIVDVFTKPELKGEINFGLPEDFAANFLSEVLVYFSRIHPRIQLNVECDLTVNLFERFKDKEFDIVLVKMRRPEDFPYGVDVWKESLEWVGSRSCISSESPLPLILSPKPCIYRASALEALETVNKSWRIAFSSTSFLSNIAAVKAGMGLSLLPRLMIPEGIEILDEPFLPPLPDIHVSLLKQQSSNPSIDSLETFILNQLRKLPI